ncbi:MAG TPA: hypothetical protein VJ672_16010, partial [Gemmatimonadaceae bacterium]|nr:hypothetical protein [Gemmatimonadaceae bacterium]
MTTRSIRLPAARTRLPSWLYRAKLTPFLCLTIGAAVALVMVLRAPWVLLVTGVGLSLLVHAQRRRHPFLHPRATLLAAVTTGLVFWCTFALSGLVALLVVEFDAFVAVTAPAVIPWTVDTLSDWWTPAGSLLRAGIGATLAVSAVLYGAVRVLAEMRRAAEKAADDGVGEEHGTLQAIAPPASTNGRTPKRTYREIAREPAVVSPPAQNTAPLLDSAVAKRLSIVAAYIGVCALVWGLGIRSPVAVCAAASFIAGACALSDIARSRRGGLTCMTIFAIMSAGFAFANVLGLLSADGPLRNRYFLYVAEQHLYLASLLALANSLFPALGFWLVWRTRAGRAFSSFAPQIRGSLKLPALVLVCTVGSAASIVANLLAPTIFVGTFTGLLQLLPCTSVFLLSFVGTRRRMPS